MKHIILPDKAERRLIFYLAMEEFVARELDEDEAFFLWQVEPTVIFGRNQLMEAEVNVDYCRANGIRIFRRKSGGGCVYSDKGNLMLSYVTKGENVGFVFDRYLRRVALTLRRAGINASVSGRNDILVDGKKVSGNAFFKLPGKCIVPGTLLYDTDFLQMQQAITPSESKLQSKGVASVRQHVANLKDYLSTDIETFKQFVVGQFCNSERILTAEEVARIEEIEKTYLDESFFSGSNPSYTVTKNVKIPGAGELTVGLELRNGVIRRVSLTGDYFQTADPTEELNLRLRNKPVGEAAEALSGFDLSAYLIGIPTSCLIEIINT